MVIKILIISSIVVSVLLYLWFIFFISTDHVQQKENESRMILLERKHELVEQKKDLEQQLNFLMQIEDYNTCTKVQGMLKRVDDALDYINRYL